MLIVHLLLQSDLYNQKKVKVEHNLVIIEDPTVRKFQCVFYSMALNDYL